MAQRERIPPAILPFVQLPKKHSQTLITSVLGASSTWLLIQHIAGLLGLHRTRLSHDASTGQRGHDAAVVLVSWMRDWDFWRSETRRATGIDLQQRQQQGQFVFVDGLSNLFVPAQSDVATSRPAGAPARGAAHAGRAPAVNAPDLQDPITLHGPDLNELQTCIARALRRVTSTDVVLILDCPSILLQTTSPIIDSTKLDTFILNLRTEIHALICAVPADDALVAPAAVLDIQDPGQTMVPFAPLDADNAAFTVSMGHHSDMVMQCRRLDSGWAEDVSGILRVTINSDEERTETGDGHVEEGEWLYHIAPDSSVKAWSRGPSA